MELILQKGLEHQQKPIERILKVFENVQMENGLYYSNPIINLADSTLKDNIKDIQKEIRTEIRGSNEIGNTLCLDIKMETGTGKTYVYTETMYALHKKYGINKFIVAVPSLAIKAGSASFLQDNYIKRHFSNVCDYNADIEVCVLEAKKSGNKGRKFFPSVVRDFVNGSNQIKNKIYVMIVNAGLIKGSTKLLSDEYDYAIANYYRPFNAIKATKPFVIIDEPHRFKRDDNTYKTIIDEIAPQCVIRFGATFPEITTGKGKNKQTKKDYINLLYDLNVCEAFKQNLVKGIAKEHPELDTNEEKIHITSIQSKTSVTLCHIQANNRKMYTLSKGDSLGQVSSIFNGVYVDSITKDTVYFSNGEEKRSGDEFAVDVFMESYQEAMLYLALKRHFETERANFRRNVKIKTLALFFINDINSYRNDDDHNAEHLRILFEKLLKQRIEEELKSIESFESDYKDYLQASLSDLSACCGAYFAKDNSSSEDAIADEVNEILKDKKLLLSIRKPDGSFNTRRFIFSKWTLKEGWDNPNVFTIAKLRTSGSDISKLQEVGRGLRLPVDEKGNRISDEDFTLNYIVDFTEKKFADELLDEINSEIARVDIITEEQLQVVAKTRGIDTTALFITLLTNKYLDMNKKIIQDNKDKFFEEYPEFANGIGKSKVIDRNKKETRNISIRSAKYDELKDLWLKINEKYLLFYNDDVDELIPSVLQGILEDGALKEKYIQSSREFLESDGIQVVKNIANGTQFKADQSIKYNEFLKIINKITNIPITILHQAFIDYSNKHGEIDSKLFNQTSAGNIVNAFNEWKAENLLTRFSYKKANIQVGETALSNKDGTPKKEIVQGRIGTKIEKGTPYDKYLYDAYTYDSPLELNNIKADIDGVIVYGKIPRSSVSIPTITGGFYSPDFMYVVKKKDGTKVLNLVIETKGVENKTELRGIEKVKIDNAKSFFEQLTLDGYEVHFETQLNNREVKSIIDSM